MIVVMSLCQFRMKHKISRDNELRYNVAKGMTFNQIFVGGHILAFINKFLILKNVSRNEHFMYIHNTFSVKLFLYLVYVNSSQKRRSIREEKNVAKNRFYYLTGNYYCEHDEKIKKFLDFKLR